MYLTLIITILVTISTAKPITSLLVDITSILSAHNQYRARHNSPPVNWNNDIANIASEWASRCVFEHSQVSYLLGDSNHLMNVLYILE
jgi:hypothetical protein